MESAYGQKLAEHVFHTSKYKQYSNMYLVFMYGPSHVEQILLTNAKEEIAGSTGGNIHHLAKYAVLHGYPQSKIITDKLPKYLSAVHNDSAGISYFFPLDQFPDLKRDIFAEIEMLQKK